jgi:hypothetical protein
MAILWKAIYIFTAIRIKSSDKVLHRIREKS